MTDQTQHILGAADSAHQGIELAKSLLRESLGNMGEILTQGCEGLGTASLGSTMRLGQCLKQTIFILDDLLKDAHGLCVLLGHDLGVCEDTEDDPASEGKRGKRAAALWYKPSRVLGDDGPDLPSERMDYHEAVFGDNIPEPVPGEDEFDDGEQPF